MSGWKRVIVWTPPVLALIAVGIAFNSRSQATRAESAVISAIRQREELRLRLRQAEEHLAVVKSKATKNENNASPKISEEMPTLANNSVPPVTAKLPARPVDWRILVARDPELRELHLKAFEADLDGNWGPLFKQLNLSEEKMGRFKEIMLEHERDRLDVTALAGDQQLGLGDELVQKQRSADGAVLAAKMRTLLEPNELKAYNRYHHDFELQPIVAEQAASLYFTETPLDLRQARELLTVLSDNSEKRNYGFVLPGTLNWDAALAQIEANPIFSPALRESFRRRRDVEMSEAQIEKTIDAAMSRAGVDPDSTVLPGRTDFIRIGR